MFHPVESGLALLAGLATVASPCVLPVLPILLGVSIERAPGAANRRALLIVAGFLLSYASFVLALGAVWTPCAGPVLAAIIALVVQARDPVRSVLLVVLYARWARDCRCWR